MIEHLDSCQENAILESFVDIVKAPYGDFVCIEKLARALNDTTTLQKIVAFLRLTPEGKQAFIDLPVLGAVDLQQLHQLPKPSLGYEYADHMLRNGLTPLPVREVENDPGAFVSRHLGETHDIWHVVTGCNTDKPGEVQLQAFCVAQLTSDRFFLALLAKNLLKTAMYEVELCDQIMDGLTQGWLMGKRAKPLFGVQWNRLWKTPLEDLKASFNISPI